MLAEQAECSLKAFDAALTELAYASSQVRRAVVVAATACMAADGDMPLKEGELLRAVAAVLACPMAPDAAGATGESRAVIIH